MLFTFILFEKEESNIKQDVQTARRNLNSPNIKTRKRALKIIKQHKRNRKSA
nr:putative metal homeostasis protein [Staphylococcus sp. acrmy]